MTNEEIENYILTGSRSLVCIFREQLKGLDLLVMSFYLMGKPGAYVLSVEFDPVDMVDNGEGWIWHSEYMSIGDIVYIVERHLNIAVRDWENITRTGRLSLYDAEVDNALYHEQENIFKNELGFGQLLLPKGVVWAKRPD